MKKYLFITLLSSFVIILCSMPSFGQGYYEPGKEYSFRSLHHDKSGVASILTIRLDEGGTAYIRRSESANQPADKPTLHVFAPLNQIATVTSENAGIAHLEIRGDTTQYWLISLDSPSNIQLKPGDKIEVSCDCRLGNGVCDVSYIQQGNNLNATCVARTGCQSCKMTVTVIKNTQRISGGVVLLKANQVIVE